MSDAVGVMVRAAAVRLALFPFPNTPWDEFTETWRDHFLERGAAAIEAAL